MGCKIRGYICTLNRKVIRMKRSIFTFVLIACFSHAMGQNRIADMTLDREFAAQVKSIDEFIARFNGDESHPEISSDSIRRDNIIALFDFQMSHKGLDDIVFKYQILDFAKSALSWGNKLSISSGNAYAEAICSIKYSGKQYHITLLMTLDKTSDGNLKWAICGVKGMASLGIYNDKRLTISPVEHETHFMSLQDLFQANQQYVPSMRSNDKEIDEMSFFFGLCVAKVIEFIQVDELKFHFVSIPKYAFVVEEIGRPGNNSGWLITQITEFKNEADKQLYLDNLFEHKK